ncbi:hypothetical protein BPAE_0012g00650 [Botrytis paeoniae]|uniref:Uncharacterized protein n=1 Tax=Botrytis paeoniae TaxID=278948 RepID=A0A4Z1G2K9_9HELO|nr:hypothetical protein BPAE_0012g00650 [Botrytis paeoniae]
MISTDTSTGTSTELGERNRLPGAGVLPHSWYVNFGLTIGSSEAMKLESFSGLNDDGPRTLGKDEKTSRSL